MRLSVVTCTKRVQPYFGWAIDSLNKQTFKDFEYIIVDGLYDLRKNDVLEMLEEAEFKWTYVPDKPNIWKGIGPALPNARNTGFMFATGDQIVFHDDACRMEPNWLERHYHWAKEGYCVAGTWISYQSSDENDKWIEGVYGQETRSKEITKPTECTGAWLYGCNFSVPLDAAIEANGNDELYCGQMGNEDCDFGIRVCRLGYRAIFDPSCIVHYFAGPTSEYRVQGIHPQASGKQISGDLDTELARPQKELRLDSGVSHYANEWLIQLLLKQPSRFWPLGNTFQLSDLRSLRERWQVHGALIKDLYNDLETWKWPIEVDWRDYQPLSEMV